MYFKLLVLIAIYFLAFSYSLDSVSENLTLRPLTNGDWLLSLDLSIRSTGISDLFQNPEDSYFIMDTMPIDLAKLYVKTKSDWFEANLGFGEWKDSVWGDRPELLITNGLSLVGCWTSLDKKLVYDQYSSLCFGLWGVTGSMFPNLVSEESYVHDLTDLYANDYETDSDLSSTVLISSDFEDRACLDTVYKLRMIYPCLCTNGLVSLMGDERLFVRSSYRGVNLRLERSKGELIFRARVQFTVSRSSLPSDFGGFFPDGKFPNKCLTVSKSTVMFLYPDSLKSQNYNSVSFNYLEDSTESINEKFQELLSTFKMGYEILQRQPELLFEVSELESRYLRVLKRVQSSLLIKVSNLSPDRKKLCVHQPLPYWLKPLLHSLTITVESLKDERLFYRCNSAGCFARNSETTRNYSLFLDYSKKLLPKKVYCFLEKVSDWFEYLPELPTSQEDPLMIYELGNNWNSLGLYMTLPPQSVLYLSVELSKDNITYEDIHLSAHRGQLIPSGLLLDMQKFKLSPVSNYPTTLMSLSSYTSPNFFYFMTSFFSHIVLPDNTMVFNVMAMVGAVVALTFGLVFNVLTKDWENKLKI